MFSFPLFERLKAELPEFEEVTAFQAGAVRLSVRKGSETAARPLRSEYVTGNYFSTLGINAFGGRVLTADDDRPAAPPVVVLSYHVWQGTYGGDPSIVGATLLRRRAPVHRRRHRSAGVLWRNTSTRPAGSLDSPAAGAVDQRRHVDSSPADLRLAARDRPLAGRAPRRTGMSAADDGRPAPVDAIRLGVSRGLVARDHPGATQAGHHRRACGRGCRRS